MLQYWFQATLVLLVGTGLSIATDSLIGGFLGWAPAILVVAVLSRLTVQRLHDRGFSAWRLLTVVIPVVGALYLFIECGLCRSSMGPNRYGPQPGYSPDYLKVQ